MMSTDPYIQKLAIETETRLKVVRARMHGLEAQMEPLKTELAIYEAAQSSLEKELAWRLLRASDLNGHVVEFATEFAGPNPRRMIVSGAELAGTSLVLTGKVFTSKGTLTKEDWSVPQSRARDCGKYLDKPT